MTTVPINERFAIMDNQQLLDTWSNIQQGEAFYRAYRQRIEYELQQRMQRAGATTVFHEHLTCELKKASPTYDYGKLRGLAELVPPEELATGFIPAHEETVQVPDKWNATKFKTWTKYGDAVSQVIQAAMIPGAIRLTIKRREEP